MHVLERAESQGNYFFCSDVTYLLRVMLVSSDVDHALHQCDARFCSIQCQLCKRLCADQDHMHGLDSSAIHLCGCV
jgi:hypothetical protein